MEEFPQLEASAFSIPKWCAHDCLAEELDTKLRLSHIQSEVDNAVLPSISNCSDVDLINVLNQHFHCVPKQTDIDLLNWDDIPSVLDPGRGQCSLTQPSSYKYYLMVMAAAVAVVYTSQNLRLI